MNNQPIPAAMVSPLPLKIPTANIATPNQPNILATKPILRAFRCPLVRS
ncbi:MAG: hypothetical protein IJV35_10325 [Neisseriaceae bacterium]|nr:hypothetical protein [Neisseriaceae bacterium]